MQSFGQFFGARVLLGVGEAPQFPTGARVVRDWFNPRDRGLATGIFNCASSLGTAIAVPLLTFLMLSFGWRVMFMIMGVAGLAMAAIWYFAYRNPTDVALTAEENVYRTQGDPPGQRTQVTLREWKQLFRFRTTWGMILGYFGCIYLTWIYTAWLPGYLEIERHMSVKFTGFAAAMPFAWGVVGGVLGGYIVGHSRAPRRVAGEEPKDIRPRSPCAAPRPARSPRPSSPATRSRSRSFRPRCFSSMSPAPAPGR